jgi:hypothetical protein
MHQDYFHLMDAILYEFQGILWIMFYTEIT